MNSLVRKLPTDQQGMGLIDILIGVAILGGAIVGLMQLTGSNQKMATKSSITNAYSLAVNNISALMVNSSHCNANFRGRAAGTNVSLLPANAILRCTSGTCNGSGTSAVLYPVVTTSWKLAQTQMGNNIRLASARYTVAAVTGRALGSLTLEVNIQTFDGATTKDNILKFGVPVVMNGGTVLACPKAWNTTVID